MTSFNTGQNGYHPNLLGPGAVARSNARPPGIRTVAGSILTFGNIFSWIFGHEIISRAILFQPLLQVEQLSVTCERMCTKYWLTA